MCSASPFFVCRCQGKDCPKYSQHVAKARRSPGLSERDHITCNKMAHVFCWPDMILAWLKVLGC